MTTTLPGKEDGAVQENDGKTLWNKQAFSLHNNNSKKKKIDFCFINQHYLGTYPGIENFSNFSKGGRPVTMLNPARRINENIIYIYVSQRFDVFKCVEAAELTRFKDFQKISNDLSLESLPIVFNVDNAPARIQLELINLQSNLLLKKSIF